jgi:hypothetical protein
MEITEAAISSTEIVVDISEKKKDDFALPINLNDSFIQNVNINKLLD